MLPVPVRGMLVLPIITALCALIMDAAMVKATAYCQMTSAVLSCLPGRIGRTEHSKSNIKRQDQGRHVSAQNDLQTFLQRHPIVILQPPQGPDKGL